MSCSVALRFLYWRKKIGAMPLDRGQSYSSNSPASANNVVVGVGVGVVCGCVCVWVCVCVGVGWWVCGGCGLAKRDNKKNPRPLPTLIYNIPTGPAVSGSC